MLYADENVRHEFHQRPYLLQIVCQLLESALYDHSYHLRVIGVNGDTAEVAVEALVTEAMINMAAVKYAIHNINKQFERRDGKATVQVVPADPALLSVIVTGAQDLRAPL